jgi:hypothetical protein
MKREQRSESYPGVNRRIASLFGEMGRLVEIEPHLKFHFHHRQLPPAIGIRIPLPPWQSSGSRSFFPAGAITKSPSGRTMILQG